eukprot:1729083-Pleurochrysis_carterae.AAC.1
MPSPRRRQRPPPAAPNDPLSTCCRARDRCRAAPGTYTHKTGYRYVSRMRWVWGHARECVRVRACVCAVSRRACAGTHAC